MAGGTATPLESTPSPRTAAAPNPVESYIERRLRETRRRVKAVDIAAGLMTLAAGTLAYLLVAAVLDHWLVKGGLGARSRFLLLLGLVGAAGYYFCRRLLPPLVYRISPIFAADTIEKGRPTLKNSLINFLLLRGHRREVSPMVFEALQQRAAADLKQVGVDTAVDRGHVIRLGYLLAGILAVFCLYLVISPKSPLRSAARILAPWARIAAPTRVTIEEIKPGDMVAFHGESVNVSAEVKGLQEAEPVLLYYSTADGQSVDQAIPMTHSEDQYHYARYTAIVPPGSLGLQQDYEYYLSAGDCTTSRFKIAVQIAPTIRVEGVDYHYPPYTGIADRTAEHQGDIRAIEGTEITIHAQANQDIRRAEIDLNCDGRRGLTMSASGRTATGRLTLRLSKDDPTRPEHDCYQLRFTDQAGHQNRRPIRYQIEVIPDLPPEVQVLDPQQAETQVAVAGRLEIRVRAEDPDFGLRQVAVRAEQGGRSLSIRPVLKLPAPEKPHQGEFQAAYAFEPGRLGLKAGDRVAYWAEAEDNKEPNANRSVTDKRWINIVAPATSSQQPQRNGDRGSAQPQGPQDQSKPQDRSGQQDSQQPNPSQKLPPDQPQKPGENKSAAEKQRPGQNEPKQPDSGNDSRQQPEGPQDQTAQAGNDSGKGQPSDAAGGQGKQSDKSAQERREPIDPANEGDAIEEINNHREEQQGEGGGQRAEGGGRKAEGQQEKAEGGGRKAEDGGQKADGQQQKAEGGGRKADGQQAEAEGGGRKEKAQDQQQKADGQQQKAEGGGRKADGQQEKAEGGERKAEGQQQKADGGGRKADGQQEKAEGGGRKADGQQPKAEAEGGGRKADGQQQKAEAEGGGRKAEGQQQKADGSFSGRRHADPSQKAEGQQRKPAEEQLGTEAKPGEQKMADAQKAAEQKSMEQESPEGKSASPQPGQQEPPGAGKKSSQSTASPEPQGANQPRQKKPGDAGQDPQAKQEKPDPAQSPSISPKQSDSQGDTVGDRSGGGQKGGGQRSNRSGIGSAGTHTDAESGGSKSEQQGEGETGNRAGNQVASKDKTGSSVAQERRQGDGSNAAPQQPGGEGPGKQPGKQDSSGGQASPNEPTDGGQPGNKASDQPGSRGQGSPAGGGATGNASETPPSPPPGEPGGDQPNLDYARKQTDLALEHLKDQVAKEKPDLLDRLGWTPDEAKRFLDRWEQMEQAAGQQGPRGEAAKKQLDEALNSLGLRHRGTQLRGGQTPRDQVQNLRDAGRFTPPPEWAEQVRQYHRGVAGSKQ